MGTRATAQTQRRALDAHAVLPAIEAGTGEALWFDGNPRSGILNPVRVEIADTLWFDGNPRSGILGCWPVPQKLYHLE